MSSEVRFPQVLLNIGFLFALTVAAACLVMSSWYLFTFLEATNSGVESVLRTAQERPETPATVTQLGILARTAMARFALLSCGVSVGMGFGFLGFALFLLGIKGEMDVAAQSENAKIKIARMAPGVFVILCASVLIAVCITFRTEYEFKGAETTQTPAPPDVVPPAPGGPAGLPAVKPGDRKP
jgi:hypothetical protein